MVRFAAYCLAQQTSRADRRAYVKAPVDQERQYSTPLLALDGYHGGIPFWDWILLPGGLWTGFFWPAVFRVLMRRTEEFPTISLALELDGYTFTVMTRTMPDDLAALHKIVERGQIEIVNGTYSQPFLQTISGEANLRQFFEGLSAIEEATRVRVTSYATQEPCFCVQLPQILRGFGYQRALLRTHWGAFGTERAFDALLLHWQGPDGTIVPAVPRYSLLDYSRLMNDPLHPGIVAGGLTVTSSGQPQSGKLTTFQAEASQKGIFTPLITQFTDVAAGPTPMPVLKKLRLTTLSEYVALVSSTAHPKTMCLAQDDLPMTLPWGLQGDALMRARVTAEEALLAAEQRDAQMWWQTGQTDEARLRAGWRNLLLAQHHDFQVCGPWLSRKHGVPMSAVGIELCKEAEQIAHDVLLKQANACSKFRPGKYESGSASPVPQTSVDAQGTLTILIDDQVVIDGGAFLTVWYNGTMHDSRVNILGVESDASGYWYVRGAVGDIPFEETICLGERIDVEVTFDFGTGMLFGPQEPCYGYYTDDKKKLCAVFPTSFDTVVRDTPFYFEPTQTERFAALSWVGLEDGTGHGLALLGHGARGYDFDRATHTLRCVLAWSPSTWLYDSDDSVTRNGSRFTPLRGKQTFHYALQVYSNRAQAARVALEYAVPQPDWLRVTPDVVLLTALFVHKDRLYARLWNPTSDYLEAELHAGEPVHLYAVDFRLEQPVRLDSKGIALCPWGIQTVLLERCAQT
jgi:hypothetical protein